MNEVGYKRADKTSISNMFYRRAYDQAHSCYGDIYVRIGLGGNRLVNLKSGHTTEYSDKKFKPLDIGDVVTIKVG